MTDWTGLAQTLSEQLDKLSAALTDAGVHFWPLAVRHQVVLGVRGVVCGVLYLVVAAVLGFRVIPILSRKYAKTDRWDGDEAAWVVGMVVSGVAIILLVIVSLAGIEDAIPRLLNPEWLALRSLLGK